MKFRPATLLCLLALAISLPGSEAIYEKNKGANDWHVSNLGQLQDVKFIEDEESFSNKVYAVSRDGVLSLFNLDAEQFVWKKRLTLADVDSSAEAAEVFNLKYLSRNLLVHSQRRAMLVNTASHANFEIDYRTYFGSAVGAQDGHHPLASLFDFEGQIYSCFVYGNQAVVYRAAQFLQEVSLDSADASLVPLELKFDTQTQNLLVLAKSGPNQLKTFSIEFTGLQVDLIAQEDIGGSEIQKFESTYATQNFVILSSQDGA